MSENTNPANPGEAAVTELLNADEVGRTVARIAHQIIEKTALDGSSAPRVVLLGIPSGGAPLAEKLARRIEEYTGVRVETGSLDITLFRDDLAKRPHRALRPTRIPEAGIDGTVTVLVDDVLFSGRTIRAALDALNDIGRPDVIQLAVLVDRGHRQLPIRADYVGKNLPTARHEDVRVLAEEIDGRDAVILSRTTAS